jgi:hypothetical protein
MLALLIAGGIGMVLLLATLAFLAVKLATKDYNNDEDQAGILEDDYEEEYSGHFDTIDNERAIFIIEERVNLSREIEGTDKIVTTSKEEQINPREMTNLLKQLSFAN